MISKTMLKIDLIGQSLIIGGLLLATALQPEVFFFGIFLAFFCLGFWQFFNGLIEAIYFQNKTRQKYIFASISYLVGFIFLSFFNDFYTVKMANQFVEIFTIIYSLGGTLAFAGWYFYRTYKDLLDDEYQNPRTFWDYEF
jgi:hypothetical protein